MAIKSIEIYPANNSWTPAIYNVGGPIDRDSERKVESIEQIGGDVRVLSGYDSDGFRVVRWYPRGTYAWFRAVEGVDPF